MSLQATAFILYKCFPDDRQKSGLWVKHSISLSMHTYKLRLIGEGGISLRWLTSWVISSKYKVGRSPISLPYWCWIVSALALKLTLIWSTTCVDALSLCKFIACRLNCIDCSFGFLFDHLKITALISHPKKAYQSCQPAYIPFASISSIIEFVNSAWHFFVLSPWKEATSASLISYVLVMWICLYWLSKCKVSISLYS